MKVIQSAPMTARRARVVAACFGFATVAFFISGWALGQPLMLVAAGCNLVATFSYQMRAGQLARDEERRA